MLVESESLDSTESAPPVQPRRSRRLSCDSARGSPYGNVVLIPKCLRTYGAPFKSKYRAIFQVPRVVPPSNFVLHMLLQPVDDAQQVLTLVFAHMSDDEVMQLAITCLEMYDASRAHIQKIAQEWFESITVD